MTNKEVIRRLEENLPVNLETTLTECGFPLQIINWGCFRAVYRILGTSLVIKFPFACNARSKVKCIQHARNEYEQWTYLKKSGPVSLKKHLPKIYWFDPQSGITVMEFYRPPRIKDGHKLPKLCAIVRGLFSSSDYAEQNVGIDRKGTLKIIDLGLFSKRKQK